MLNLLLTLAQRVGLEPTTTDLAGQKEIAVSTKLSTLLRALPIELSLHTKQDLVEPNHLAVNANPLRQRLLASYNLRKLSYSWANNWI